MKVTICLRESLMICFGFWSRLKLVVVLGFLTFELGCVVLPFFLSDERRNRDLRCLCLFETREMYVVYADDVFLFS